MSEVKKAIEEITYASEKFPRKTFRVITANKEEALPYLREAVDRAIRGEGVWEQGSMLHFYALFFLGEFQDRDSFSRIMELVSLPEDTVEFLLGDCITAELKDILYNTYDGNMELLKKSIQNEEIYEYVKSAMLDVMGQLYLDGVLEESELKDFLKQCVHRGGEYDYVYDAIGEMICRCHFIDMLPEIRYLFDNDLIDTFDIGEYDSYVDAMFDYQKDKEEFCKTPFSAVDALEDWAMFSDSENEISAEEVYDEMVRAKTRGQNKTVPKKKIGRNDPCPCGSGKKYKFCCLNKPKDAIDCIESLEERNKRLKDYPYTGTERIDGRIYLADYFDKTSIETDQLLYLALMDQPRFILNRNTQAAEEEREKEYLYLAFQKWMARMEKEEISSFDEYDKKYSIHYLCKEWLGELCRLLQKNNESERYEEVRKQCEKYCEGVSLQEIY